MNDKIKELKRQLAEAEEEEKLHNEIRRARCPLCGSHLEFKARDGYAYGDCSEYDTTAEIKCPSCGCFGYRDTVHQSHYDRCLVKPLTLLRSVWSTISRYAVTTNTEKK